MSFIKSFVLQEEEAERLRLEKEQREHEEYLKLKSEFCIEEEGEEEAGSDEDEHENMLQEFIEHLKVNLLLLQFFKIKFQFFFYRKLK